PRHRRRDAPRGGERARGHRRRRPGALLGGVRDGAGRLRPGQGTDRLHRRPRHPRLHPGRDRGQVGLMGGDVLPLVPPILAGALIGLGLFVAVLAVVGVPERDPSKPPRFARKVNPKDTSTRLAVGTVAGLLTWWLTGWPVAGAAIGLLAANWDR